VRIQTTIDEQRLDALQAICLPHDKPYDVKKGFWWIVTENKQDIGFAGLVSLNGWPLCGYLCRAGVVPDQRGRGIQRKLIKARVRKAQQLGWNTLITNTFDNIKSANNLISAGFKMYYPERGWGTKGTLYWIKNL
jgi:GNAT superfamily N-acetyltransferase